MTQHDSIEDECIIEPISTALTSFHLGLLYCQTTIEEKTNNGILLTNLLGESIIYLIQSKLEQTIVLTDEELK